MDPNVDMVGTIHMLLPRADPLRDRPALLFANALEICEEILEGAIRRSNEAEQQGGAMRRSNKAEQRGGAIRRSNYDVIIPRERDSHILCT